MKEESEPDRCEHGPWYEEYKDRTRFIRASTELAESTKLKALETKEEGQ